MRTQREMQQMNLTERDHVTRMLVSRAAAIESKSKYEPDTLDANEMILNLKMVRQHNHVLLFRFNIFKTSFQCKQFNLNKLTYPKLLNSQVGSTNQTQ